MTDAATITVRREGAATTIVLDRRESLNAWNRRLGEELLAALRDAAADDGVRAVRLTGAGRAFSAGADLRDVSSADHEQTPDGHPDVAALLRERYHPIIELVREMPKPVLAAVNGPAAGLEASIQGEMAASGDFAEGVAAFIDRRAAVFEGR